MKRVLVVDDEADHRLIIRAMLEHCDYACDEAEMEPSLWSDSPKHPLISC